jgi:hypothetical protein
MAGGRGRFLVVVAAVAAVVALPSSAAHAHIGSLPPELISPRDLLPPTGGLVPRPAPGCPTKTNDARFESEGRLLAENQVMQDFGRRPTGSAAQLAFISWLEARLDEIPGVSRGSIPYTIDRWVEQSASLSAGPSAGPLTSVAISGAVPYAKPSPAGGASGRLLYLGPNTALSAANIQGRIVVRDAVPGTVPYAAFRAVSWFEWDPDGSLITDAPGNYERDFAGYNQRMTDLDEAARGGAAGLVFVHGFPRAQVEGQYAPYDGIHWQVPAVYVGVDEGEQLKRLAANGGRATVDIAATDVQSPTRTVVATLPGASAERMVIESHTDGMNAIWDNGPIAILALARHFASLPKACRPRTLQFVFTTGHLYQRLLGGQDRGGSAELVAKTLDSDYSKGSLAMVFALEHLGAREYAANPRPNGLPGRVLQPTGRNELNTLFVGESPLLVGNVIRAVIQRDIRRTFVMRGADAPGATIPPHNSYGGEGGAYQQHLIPTIALVTGPWTLYDPAFGMEAIDGGLLRKQTLLFADLIQRLSPQPRALIGGGYLAYRAARSLICDSALTTLKLTRCPGDPYG